MDRLSLRRFKTVPGTTYGTPKEVWGFRAPARRGAPLDIAERFLEVNCELLGIEGIQFGPARIVESLGARHVILQQKIGRHRVDRAYVTVHVSRSGRVYLAKNRARPRELTQPDAQFTRTELAARRRALKSVSPTGVGALTVLKTERLWFPRKKTLRPAYRVHVRRRRPRGDWLVYVDGDTGRVLRKYDNLAQARATAKVFDPNPVIALGGTRELLRNRRLLAPPAAAYVSVKLERLKTNGRLDGERVTTKPTTDRVRRSDGKFEFTSDQPAFEEVMAYFHIDAAIGRLEELGYRGDRAIFKKPVPVDANGTEEDNSWYSPEDRDLTFGLGGVDDAEDAEIIVHELGHAIQDAICPGFGQSLEAAAIGEGFGDYFAASFFAVKKPARYLASVGTWDAIKNSGSPPCLRRLDEKLTYESFDHGADADEHENGKIWSAALWEIWNAVGRDVADRIIVESHFQLDGYTTFARGARAIIDADENLYDGKHRAALRRIFRRRGIGPVE